MGSPRREKPPSCCLCRLLYLGSLGSDCSEMCFCTAGIITPVLEWSTLSTLTSSPEAHISSYEDQRDLKTLYFYLLAAGFLNRLFPDCVPWRVTETCLFEKRICSLHSWEMPWLLYSCIIDECQYLLSFLCMNLSGFSVNFRLLLFSCAVRLKCLFQTCCYFAFESHAPAVCLWIQSQCPSLTDQLLLSFLCLQFMALCCISWNMETQARPHISALISALFSVVVGHSSLLVCLGLAVILSSFFGEAHVHLLCCCHPQKAFFQHCLVCEALIHHPPDALACVHK